MAVFDSFEFSLRLISTATRRHQGDIAIFKDSNLQAQHTYHPGDNAGLKGGNKDAKEEKDNILASCCRATIKERRRTALTSYRGAIKDRTRTDRTDENNKTRSI
jgi:hypothetical protein